MTIMDYVRKRDTLPGGFRTNEKVTVEGKPGMVWSFQLGRVFVRFDTGSIIDFAPEHLVRTGEK